MAKTDLDEALEAVEETDQAEVDLVEETISIAVQEKCIKQFVLTVRKNVKFLSNQQKVSQYIAEIALLTTKSFSF